MKLFFCIFAFLITIASSTSSALTVGISNPVSKIGDPFKAEVELYNIYDLRPSDISFRVISPKGMSAKYKKLFDNISTGFYSSNGIGWISISSTEPVFDRSFIFSIEIVWPDGKATRTYSLRMRGKLDEKTSSGCSSRGVLARCVN